MPDVHVPKVHSMSIWKLLLEVLLISVGVFLGLMGEQWRQGMEHRELARQALQRFASELQANQMALRDVVDYHAEKRTMLEKYFAADPKARQRMSISFNGIRSAQFEHAAWDLAVATQSLTYIDPPIASALSKIYAKQEEYKDLSNGVLQELYQPENALAIAGVQREFGAADTFWAALVVYYDDVTLLEPELNRMYAKVLPQIAAALGGSK